MDSKDLERNESPTSSNPSTSGSSSRTSLDIETSPFPSQNGETTSLLPSDGKNLDYKTTSLSPSSASSSSITESTQELPTSIALTVIPLLLIGVFISSADGTLVLATYDTISSTFNSFSSASWLTTAYSLAACAFQPLTGKLSDVYGRKSVLLVSYGFFGVGSVVCGIAQTMGQVILGRIISGIGAAGMTVIVSVLITDLVPLLQVASYRSYVNVISTLGRSIGGPMGGFLADTIGWRFSFILQGPLILFAILLVGFKLPSSTSPSPSPPSPSTLPQPSPSNSNAKQEPKTKLQRIDFVGAFLLASTIVSLLGALSLGGQSLEWSHPLVVGLLLDSAVIGVVFGVYEVKVASEPIFPPSLIVQRDVATPYGIIFLQSAAQLAMMYSIPLYFRTTQLASPTTAGSHLFPAVLGNTVGALLSGLIITRTGHYKALTIFSSLSSSSSYLMLILFWRGKTSWAQSLEIIPGGFGTGIAFSATFIALTSSVKKSEMAVATGGMYLSSALGSVVGVAIGSSVQMSLLRSILSSRLPSKIVEAVISDVGLIRDLEDKVRKIVVQGYVRSLEGSHLVSLGCSLTAFVLALSLRERPLK